MKKTNTDTQMRVGKEEMKMLREMALKNQRTIKGQAGICIAAMYNNTKEG